MTMVDFDAEAHLTHMERVLGLTIDPDWRAGIAAHLAVAARMSNLVLSFPLDDHIEPAARFEPGR